MTLPGPSTYVPLARRFTNERDRELRETRELYAWVAARQAAFRETPATLSRTIMRHLWDIPEPLCDHVIAVVAELIEGERYLWELPPPDVERMSLNEYVEYRNFLYLKQHFFQNEDAYLSRLREALERVCQGIVQLLPDTDTTSPFTVPLISLIPEPGVVIEGIFSLFGQYHEQGIFKGVARQLYENLCRASGREPDTESRRPWRHATAADVSAAELADMYLADTAFYDLFHSPVLLRLTDEDRFNHWHVLAGSGQGKTVLIESLIRHDLQRDDPPSIVLIDPHSDLVRRLVQSDIGVDDRLIIIDPRDTKYPVALNPFAVNRERFQSYDEATKEQVTAGVIQTFGFLWSGLTNLTLTGKQDVFFRYVTRLMLTLPEVEGRNATILDMLGLMNDPTPYGRAVEALPPIPREFFVRDFMSKSFEGTKEQVRYRLQAIIESPTMARLFTAPETKVDLFTEMNKGTVILVDTAKDFLKEGSAIFGKLIISLILQAVLERAAIAPEERKPTFLMVDEAGSFFSSNIDDLLTEARKYKCGILIAHQYLDQASSSLRASLAANAGIKFASGLSAQDAAVMARDMRTTADFILYQPKLQFAAHIRGVTSSAVAVPISLPARLSQLSDDELAKRIGRNRARVALPTEPQNQPTQSEILADGLAHEDISARW